MNEVKKSRRPRRLRRPTYKHHPFAVSVTLYSPDGSPVPEEVLDQAEVYLTSIAFANNLLTSVNRA